MNQLTRRDFLCHSGVILSIAPRLPHLFATDKK